jgi:hypothetical protein
MTLTLYNTPDVTQAITLGGSPVTVANSLPGQDMRLPFNGTGGQLAALNVTNSTFPGCFGQVQVTESIVDPAGNTLTSMGPCSFPAESSMVTLPSPGTYNLFIDPFASDTAGLTLQLFNLTDLSAGVNTSGTYATAVLADSPSSYWRLDETGPATAANAIPAIKYGLGGPTSPDNAIRLNGIVSWLSTTIQYTNPTVYSFEVWFKTNTTQGGKIIGFENAQTSGGTGYDRMLYMTSSGQLIFGHWTGNFLYVTSPSSYANGQWHQAVGTYDGTNLRLYVDGSQVASTTGAGPQNFSGWWHIGYGILSGWPSAPNNWFFEGSLGQVSVWNSTALTATQVSAHYNAAGGGNYDSTVLGNSPTSYWKLNESGGPTFADATNGGNSATAQAPADNGLYVGGVTFGQSGATSSGDSAIALDGSTGYVSSDDFYSFPPIYSEECWFKTSSNGYNQGGALIGFDDVITGTPGKWDRALYMTNSGTLMFGIWMVRV